MRPVNILMGVCGFGNGHCSRQRDLIEHLLKVGHTVVMLGFKTSYDSFLDSFKQYHNFHLVETGFPITAADKDGINLEKCAQAEHNQSGLVAKGFASLAKAETFIEGRRFDIVISDTEYFSGVYA